MWLVTSDLPWASLGLCEQQTTPLFHLFHLSQSEAVQNSSPDSYLDAQSFLGQEAAVGFSVVQRGEGVLDPQFSAYPLKYIVVGLPEIFEHLLPLVNAHQ